MLLSWNPHPKQQFQCEYTVWVPLWTAIIASLWNLLQKIILWYRGLVIIGVLAILSFFVGFIGSFYKRCCLSVYLMLGTLVALAELGIILSLFFNLDGVLNNMRNYQMSKLGDDAIDAIENGNMDFVWDRYAFICWSCCFFTESKPSKAHCEHKLLYLAGNLL